MAGEVGKRKIGSGALSLVGEEKIDSLFSEDRRVEGRRVEK